MAEHIEDREHDESGGGGGERCPLGARSSHVCDGPVDDAGELLLGWVAACGGAEDSALGCAVHLGEVLVVWDPGEWHGIGSHGSPDDTTAVASAAERIAAEIADGRWIAAGPDDDGIHLRGTRTAAFRALVHAVPPVLAAQALGFSPGVAKQHARDAGTHWVSYASYRRQ
ncbi:hypothetical protein ACFRCG_07125 [Embleya sp. NPDC056575]|uniref:hypothetical protein n=1 Tax=unclassified Embleya TaxID=2699296 RepID=UPI0036CEF621